MTVTAATRAAELNRLKAVCPSLPETQSYWEADGIRTGQDLDALLAWVSWKRTYRFVRESRPPEGSHWSLLTAAEWKKSERALQDEYHDTAS